MLNMLTMFARSRKAWVMLACVAGAIGLNAVGKTTGPETLDFLKWVVGAWMGAVAIEDGAKKMGSQTDGAA